MTFLTVSPSAFLAFIRSLRLCRQTRRLRIIVLDAAVTEATAALGASLSSEPEETFFGGFVGSSIVASSDFTTEEEEDDVDEEAGHCSPSKSHGLDTNTGLKASTAPRVASLDSPNTVRELAPESIRSMSSTYVNKAAVRAWKNHAKKATKPEIYAPRRLQSARREVASVIAEKKSAIR